MFSDHVQLEKKLKEITTEMEKKKSQHSNEVSTLKNKIKALEKDNSELHHRCEKLETSVNFEKEKRLKRRNSMNKE